MTPRRLTAPGKSRLKSISLKTSEVPGVESAQLFKRAGSNRWYIETYWRGKRTTQSLKTTSEKEAIEIAGRMLGGATAGADSIQRATGGKVTVSDAIALMIETAEATDESKADYEAQGREFIRWLAERHAGLTFWNDLSQFHFRQHFADLKEAGRSPRLRRKRLFIVRATARRLAADDPDAFRDLTAGIRIVDDRPAVKRYLPLDAWAPLLRELDGQNDNGFLAVCLILLAGLRIREALHLQARHVETDGTAGAITIEETESHKPKTAGSFRAIPVCAFVAEALERRLLNVKGGPGEYLIEHKGRLMNERNFCRRVLARYLDRIGFSELTGRDLRRSFIQLLTNEVTVKPEAREIYIGHAVDGVTYQHYASKGMEALRREVVGPLNVWMGKSKEGREIWKIFKPRRAKVIEI